MLYSKFLHFTKLLYSKWKEEEVETLFKVFTRFPLHFLLFFGVFFIVAVYVPVLNYLPSHHSFSQFQFATIFQQD